jgi:hypothetical protein
VSCAANLLQRQSASHILHLAANGYNR